MLAKEVKIKTLRRQREYIKDKLTHIPTDQNDGDSAYIYVGYIHPEVIKYFENEGFVVTLIESELLTAITKGLPVHLFTISNIELSEEELKQAEEYEVEDKEDDDKNGYDVLALLNALGGGPHS